MERLKEIEKRLDRIEGEMNFETYPDSLFPELTKDYEFFLREKPQMMEYNIVVSRGSFIEKELKKLLKGEGF